MDPKENLLSESTVKVPFLDKRKNKTKNLCQTVVVIVLLILKPALHIGELLGRDAIFGLLSSLVEVVNQSPPDGVSPQSPFPR